MFSAGMFSAVGHLVSSVGRLVPWDITFTAMGHLVWDVK
jgi:hypothetical protein